MGIFDQATDWIRDKVEDAVDFWGKNISGNYKYFEYCYVCGKTIDTKYGYGDNFKCINCGLLLCEDCAYEHLIVEERILQHPALFKKGRKQTRIRCPNCGHTVWESDIETFR